jgi:hypothetical protein
MMERCYNAHLYLTNWGTHGSCSACRHWAFGPDQGGHIVYLILEGGIERPIRQRVQ